MSQIRKIKVICEGQSEVAFINNILSPFIGEQNGYQYTVLAIPVITGHNPYGGDSKGGVLSYQKVRKDIEHSLSSDSIVTTMFDFFRLPTDFPGYKEAFKKSAQDSIRVESIEAAMGQNILGEYPSLSDKNFIPYLELHEFEALLYCNLDALKLEYVEKDQLIAIDQLKMETSGMNPEDINNGPETAPSKRLINIIDYKKGEALREILLGIGIEEMRKQCPHFNRWINQIENAVQIVN